MSPTVISVIAGIVIGVGIIAAVFALIIIFEFASNRRAHRRRQRLNELPSITKMQQADAHLIVGDGAWPERRV